MTLIITLNRRIFQYQQAYPTSTWMTGPRTQSTLVRTYVQFLFVEISDDESVYDISMHMIIITLMNPIIILTMIIIILIITLIISTIILIIIIFIIAIIIITIIIMITIVITSSGEFTRNSNHQVVRWFWELVRGFEQEQKAKLLQFVTGQLAPVCSDL